jgi:hypothetical protein
MALGDLHFFTALAWLAARHGAVAIASGALPDAPVTHYPIRKVLLIAQHTMNHKG